ncbi:hypothetical protein [Bavariicoccus seileri]|nr:hypothetical protein [Bavariicoccus seileri]
MDTKKVPKQQLLHCYLGTKISRYHPYLPMFTIDLCQIYQSEVS